MTKKPTPAAVSRSSIAHGAASLFALAAVLAAPGVRSEGAFPDVNLFQNDTGTVFSFGGTVTNWGSAGAGPAVSTNDYHTNGKTLQSNGGTFGGHKLDLNSTLALFGGTTTHNFGNLLQATGPNAKIQVASTATGNPTVSGTGIQVDGTLTLETLNANRYLTIAAPTTGSGSVVTVAPAGATPTAMFFNAQMGHQGTTTVGNNVYLRMGVANALSGAGEVIVNSGGFLRLAGVDTGVKGLRGAGTVDNGVTGTGTNTVTISGNDSLTTNEFTGAVVNGGTKTLSVTKTGNATQIFGGAVANTYTGATTISGGVLEIQKASALGSAAVGGTTVNGTGTLGVFSASSVTSAEVLTLTGRGDTTAHIRNRGGNNVLSGAVTLGAGENFNLAADGTLGMTGTVNTAAIDDTGAHALNLSGAGTGTIAQAIAFGANATNQLNKTGTGTWNLDGAVTNLDTVDVDAGTLAFGAAINVSGIMNVDGTLKLKGVNATAGALTGGGTVTDDDQALVTLGADGIGTQTFSGNIADGAGTVSLQKVGDNVQVLAGASTYSGLTTISGGTLRIENASALGTSGNTTDRTIVEGGGALAVAGGITTAEQLSLKGRASETPVAVTSAGNNGLTGAISLEAGATGTDKYFDLESTTGTLTVSGPIVAAVGTTDVSLGLLGPGNTIVNGGIDLRAATGEHKVYAFGAGTKTLNGTVNLSKTTTSGEVRIGNEGGGNLTVNGDAVLTGSDSSASLRNRDSGNLMAKNVDLSGAAGEAYVSNEDNGNLTVTGVLDMSDAAGGARIENEGAGAIMIAGATLDDATAGASVLNDAAGLMVVSGALSMQNSGSAVVLNQGGGTMTIADVDMTDSGGVTRVANTGVGGTLTVNGTLTDVDVAGATAGTFKIGDGANVSDVSRFQVAAGAVINATDVALFNLEDGQALYGAGTVEGDVVAKYGSTIHIGNVTDTDIATLTFDGNLTLEEGSKITFNIGSIDVLNVIGDLSISDLVDLSFKGSAVSNFYVFANYNDLSGEFADADAPTGYSFDYRYGGRNQIALVRDNPIPVPAPLFLIGLGAIALGAGRRYARW